MKVGEAFIEIRPDTHGFAGEAERGISGSVKRLAGLAAGAFAAAGAVSFIKGSVEAAEESNKIAKITEATIKATGSAAGITAKQIGALATSISNKTGIDDEAIQTGENQLLTFAKIRNEVGKGNAVFDRATQAAVDLSAHGFGDINSASIMVGKALQDPIKGMTALQRVGVSLTDQQKAQVKAMVAAGDTLGAQKVILQAIEGQVGGTAAAVATPMARLKVAFGNLQEQIGNALIPTLSKVATFLADHLPGAIAKVQSFLGPLIDKVKLGAEALKAAFSGEGVTSDGFVGVMERIGVALRQVFDFIQDNVKPLLIGLGVLFVALTSPVSLVIAALVALYVRFESVREAVAAFGERASAAFGVVTKALQDNKPQIDAVLQAFQAVAMWIGENVVPILVRLGGVLVTLVGAHIAALINGIATLIQWFRNVVTAVGTMSVAIQTKFSEAVAFVQGIPGKIKGALGDVGGLLVGAGKAIIHGLIEGIKDGIGALKDTVGGIAGKIKSWKGPVDYDRTILIPAGQAIMDGLVYGIEDRFGSLQSTLGDVTKTIATSIPAPYADAVKKYLQFSASEGDYMNDWLTHVPASMRAGLLSAGQQAAATGQAPITVNLIVDGKQFTYAIVDPMAEALRQRDAAYT